MPYEPLHHKYRPQTFAQLVGQEAIAATLTNALLQQKIAPAYLFTGARGTGKTSSARILAKSLNCLQSNTPTAQPCGACEVCRSIANGSALDVIEIDAASNTGVDNIRELIERAQFAPVQCRYKVYVVDECHMLSTAAFNALLKTLEEPPDRVVFVLATTDPQRVLPTIISRCQRFDFRRIPLQAMVQHLSQIAEKEAIDITLEAVQLVAQISQGGLRDAESLLDQLSLLSEQISAERVWDLVGAVPERDLLALVQAIAEDDSTTVLDRARKLMDRGREPLIVLQNLASFYRDLLIAKTSPDRPDLVAVTPPTWAAMTEFAQGLELTTLLLGQQHLRTSEVQVKNTTQPRLWLEVTLLGLLPAAVGGRAAMEPRQPVLHLPAKNGSAAKVVSPSVPPATASPQAQQPAAKQSPTQQPTAKHPVIQPSEEVETSIAPQPEKNPEHSSSDPLPLVASEPVTSEPVPIERNLPQAEAEPQLDLNQTWQEVLLLVQPYSTRIMLQQQCLLLGLNGQTARIGARSDKLFRMAQERLPNIEAAFEQLLQSKIKVTLEVATAAQAAEVPVSTSPLPPPAPSTVPKPIVRETSPTAGIPASPSSGSASPTYPDASKQAVSVSTAPVAEMAEPPSFLPTWHEEDEVRGAAKSLAQFFNGQIVSVDGETITTSSLEIQAIGLTSIQSDLDNADLEDSDPDDDVPF